METFILVIQDQKEVSKKVCPFLEGKKGRVILMGLISQSSGKVSERECWEMLFTLQQEYEKKGFLVSIGLEKSSPFNLLNLVETLSAHLLIMPREKFLGLRPDEYEEFLEKLSCPLFLY